MLALDQIGTMLSPCSPRITACSCVAGAAEPHRQQAPEPERVEQRAEAHDAAGRQRQLLLGEVGEDVDRIAHHQHRRVGLAFRGPGSSRGSS